MEVRNKIIFRLELAIIIIIPVLLMFQGIDATDTGWMLTYFQNIFTSPDSVSYWFHLWLTDFTGGLWYLIFGNLGLLGFRIAGVLIFFLTSFLLYRTYREYLPADYILAGLLLGMTWHFSDKITIIHYNNLSYLYFSLALLFFHKGLKGSNKYIFLTSFIITLNGFVRLPNLLGLSIGFLYLWQRVLQGDSLWSIVKSVCFFIAGILGAVILAFSVMSILGHLQLYLKSVSSLFNDTGEAYSHYGAKSMEAKFDADIMRSLYLFAGFCLYLVPSVFFLRYLKQRSILFFRIVISVLSVIFLVFSWYFLSNSSLFFYITIGFTFITILLTFFSLNESGTSYKFVVAGALLFLICMSVGSDTGMKVGTYALLGTFPAVIGFWYDRRNYSCSLMTEENKILLKFFITESGKRFVLLVFLTFYIPCSLSSIWQGVYRDGARLNMTSSVDSRLLRGIFTQKDRALVLDELLTALQEFVKPGDPLICFESIGLVNFLTETRPALSNPWPLLEMPSHLETLLDGLENSPQTLPVVVMAKHQTRSASWPDSGPVNQKAEDIVRRKIFYGFLEKNDYSTKWQNDMFVVMTSDYKLRKK